MSFHVYDQTYGIQGRFLTDSPTKDAAIEQIQLKGQIGHIYSIVPDNFEKESIASFRLTNRCCAPPQPLPVQNKAVQAITGAWQPASDAQAESRLHRVMAAKA